MTSPAAVFLDRDGVLNQNVYDPQTREFGAPRRPEDLEIVPGAFPALATLKQAGFLLFLVSNQPDYAKGKASLEALAAVHAKFESELIRAEVHFSAFFYCYHHPDGVIPEYSGSCSCRKPSPCFLFQARDQFGVSLESSWMVGDRVTDIECGRNAGVRTIRIAEDHPALRSAGELQADFEAADLPRAVKLILHSPARQVPSSPHL